MADVCAEIMGNFGRFQARAVAVLFLLKFPTVWYANCILFTAPTPTLGEIYCLLAPNETADDNATRYRAASSDNWVKVPNPALELGDKEQKMYFCSIADNSWKNSGRLLRKDNNTEKDLEKEQETPTPKEYTKLECLQYDYVDETDKKKSLNSQFDLVCSRDFLVTLTQCAHKIGETLGTMMAFYGVRRMSPKSLLYTGLLMTITVGLMTGMVQIYEFHLVCRLLVASSSVMMTMCGGWIFQDICHGRAKTLLTMSYEFFASVGMILLPLMSQAFDTWTHLYMSITLPLLIFGLFYKIIPDSPRWLIKHDEIEDAVFILERASEINCREQYYPDNPEAELASLRDKMLAAPPPASYPALYKTGRMELLIWIILNLTWMLCGACYGGTLLNVRNFGYQFVHYNVTVVAVCEIMGLFISYYIILHSQRIKWIFSGVGAIITGIISILTWFLPTDVTAADRSMYFMAMCMPMKIMISCALSVQNNCTAELFPDNQKYTASIGLHLAMRFFGMCFVFASAVVVYGVPAVMSLWGSMVVVAGICFIVISFHPVYTKKQD